MNLFTKLAAHLRAYGTPKAWFTDIATGVILFIAALLAWLVIQ